MSSDRTSETGRAKPRMISSLAYMAEIAACRSNTTRMSLVTLTWSESLHDKPLQAAWRQVVWKVMGGWGEGAWNISREEGAKERRSSSGWNWLYGE